MSEGAQYLSFRKKMGVPRLVSAESTIAGIIHLIVTVAVLQELLAVGIVQGQPDAVDVSVGLCAAVVRPWGYPCNEYTVQTADGFLLGVQNIPHGMNEEPSGALRRPVFLQHGLLAGGDNWVINQPSESFGFILADTGYDVWIGNVRGIVWSHGHINLTTNDAEFWYWSWDELAAYDLPAMLGFVSEQTGSEILYIGHSQGTSMLLGGLMGTAQAQALANMLAGAVLICPIAYLGNITSTFDKIAADLYVDTIFNVFGVQEFNLHNQLGVELVQTVCGNPALNCTDLYRAVGGYGCCRNDTRVPFYLNFYPQGTSSKNLYHYAQMIRTNAFSKYDYGLIGNLKHYGQVTPPAYEVANFPASVPLMIVQGGQDALADPTDVQYLVSLLGSKVTERFSVARYAHGDFLSSYTANVDVYPEIMSFIENLSN